MSDEQQTKKRKVTSELGEELDPPATPHRLLIKKHSEKARAPTRGSALAAGYDLYRSNIGVHDHSEGSGLIYGSAQKRKLSRLGGKPSLIPRFQSRSLLAHMDASPHEVALVGAA